jgi:hypothetical protein
MEHVMPFFKLEELVVDDIYGSKYVIYEDDNGEGIPLPLRYVGTITIEGQEEAAFVDDNSKLHSIPVEQLETVYLQGLEDETSPEPEPKVGDTAYVNGELCIYDGEDWVPTENSSDVYIDDTEETIEEEETIDVAISLEDLEAAIIGAKPLNITSCEDVTATETVTEQTPSEPLTKTEREKLEALEKQVKAIESMLEYNRSDMDKKIADVKALANIKQDFVQLTDTVRPSTNGAIEELITALADSVTSRSIQITRSMSKAVASGVRIYNRHHSPLIVGGLTVNPDEYEKWDSAKLLDIWAQVAVHYETSLTRLSDLERAYKQISSFYTTAEAEKDTAQRKCKDLEQSIESIRQNKHVDVISQQQLQVALAKITAQQTELNRIYEGSESYVLYCPETKSFIHADITTKKVSFTNSTVGLKGATGFESMDVLQKALKLIAEWSLTEIKAHKDVAQKEKGVTSFTLMPMRVVYKKGKAYAIKFRGTEFSISADEEVAVETLAKADKPLVPVKSKPNVNLDEHVFTPAVTGEEDDEMIMPGKPVTKMPKPSEDLEDEEYNLEIEEHFEVEITSNVDIDEGDEEGQPVKSAVKKSSIKRPGFKSFKPTSKPASKPIRRRR